MALAIVVNAKTQRPVGVQRGRVAAWCTRRWPPTSCPAPPPPLEGVELVGDERTRQILPRSAAAGHRRRLRHRVPRPQDERGRGGRRSTPPSPTSPATAPATPRRSSPATSRPADRFTREVDAAAVVVNASTRFTDGEEFGFGAEIGISTQKLHARGPMGLRELTTIKYVIHGEGQVRSWAVPSVAEPRWPFESVPKVREGLKSVAYLADEGIAGVVYLADRLQQAGPRRGPGRHGQDPAGQVGGRDDRRPPHPPAVLRGPRRVEGALRVELQEAAAAHPGPARPRTGRHVERRRGGHLQRGVPAHPAAARGHPGRRPGRAADRRGRPRRGRDRGAAARDPLRLPGVDPRAGHGGGHADPAGVPHVEQHP